MKKSLFRNLRLQTYLQLLNTIIPLITTPYVSRRIGAEGLGVFSYATSIAAYFTLFAMLGTLNYGVRSIAAIKDNLLERSKRFWEIYTMQIATVLLAIVAYVVLLFFYRADRVMMLLQLITLTGYLFDVTWYYQGIEDFDITVSVSMVVRLLSLAAIFLFVRTEKDLENYTVIMLGSQALWQGSLWLFIRGRLLFVRIHIKDILRHIKPNIVLFVPLIAMTIFHYMDKTMLGILSTYEETGYYYNVDKIITIPLGVFTGIGTVMLPKMTSLCRKNIKEAGNLFVLSLDGVIVLGIAMSFGIWAIAEDFVPLFLGEQYLSCILLVRVLAPVLGIKGVSNAIRVHYLIPAEKEKIYIWSVIAGAVINIVFNYLLIPVYGALGAEIATIIAETVVLIIEVMFVAKIIPVTLLMKNVCIYLLTGGVMVVSIRYVIREISSVYLRLGLAVLVGGVVYCGMTLFIWHITQNELYKAFTDKLQIWKRERRI